MTELPEPAGQLFDLDTADYTEAAYTKEQMLQFRRDALDEAARVCEEHQTKWLKEADKHRRDRFSDYEQRDLERAKLCEKDARAIWKLKDET